MPVATAYTEDTLADWMLRAIKGNARILKWTNATDEVKDAVAATLFAYHGDGGGTIEDATNIARLERIARLAIWDATVEALTTYIDLNTGSSKIPRSQLIKNATAARDRAGAKLAQRAGLKTARIRYADADDRRTEEYEQ